METRIYKNITKKDINVIGIGIIEAGQSISLTTAHQPQVILENFPGVIRADLEEETQKGVQDGEG